MRNPSQIKLVAAIASGEKDHEVKGFMSVSGADLDDDLAAPESFDLKSFLTKGTLLYNHKLWVDDMGNPIPVGQVTSAEVVKVVSNKDDSALWNIVRLTDGSVTDTFPKQASPNLVSGDRGVFIKATVEVEEVWRRVLRRMLTGFSWHGLARYGTVRIGKVLKKFIASVSMSEVSLVFSPRQGDSMLVPVTKSAVMDVSDVTDKVVSPFVVFCIVFSPDVFNRQVASLWLAKRGFQFEDNFMELADGELVFAQIDAGMIESGSVRSMKIAKGIHVLSGLPREGEITGNEKNELFRLTQDVIGGIVLSKGVTLEENFMDSQEKVETVVTPVTETEAPAGASSVVVTPAEEVVAPVIPVAEEVVAPIEPVVSVQVAIEEPPKVQTIAQTTVDDSRRTVNEVIEKALTDATIIDRMASLMSQNIMTLVGQKFEQIVMGVQDKITRFTEVADKLATMLEAQSKAITDALAPTQVTMAKSAEMGVAQEALLAQIGELNKSVECMKGEIKVMKKSAVGEVVRQEPTHSKAKTGTQSIGSQVLPAGFMGLD